MMFGSSTQPFTTTLIVAVPPDAVVSRDCGTFPSPARYALGPVRSDWFGGTYVSLNRTMMPSDALSSRLRTFTVTARDVSDVAESVPRVGRSVSGFAPGLIFAGR